MSRRILVAPFLVFVSTSSVCAAEDAGKILRFCRSALLAATRAWDDFVDWRKAGSLGRKLTKLVGQLNSPSFKVLASGAGRAYNIRILSDDADMSAEHAESVLGHVAAYIDSVRKAGFPTRSEVDIYLLSNPDVLGEDAIASANSFLLLKPEAFANRRRGDAREVGRIVLPLNKFKGSPDVDMETLKHELGHQIFFDGFRKSSLPYNEMYQEVFADSVNYLLSENPAIQPTFSDGEIRIARDLVLGEALKKLPLSAWRKLTNVLSGMDKEPNDPWLREVVTLSGLRRRNGGHRTSVLVSPLITNPILELGPASSDRIKEYFKYWQNMALYRRSFEGLAKGKFGPDLDLNRQTERLSIMANTLYAYAVFWKSFKDHPRVLNFQHHLEKNCKRIGLDIKVVKGLAEEIRPSPDFRDQINQIRPSEP